MSYFNSGGIAQALFFQQLSNILEQGLILSQQDIGVAQGAVTALAQA